MKLTKSQKRTLVRILASAAMLTVLLVLRAVNTPLSWTASHLPIVLIPYLIVGGDVLRDSIVNIAHGQWLDEQFLMTIATVGALAIGEYHEAVFVMLFYQLGELFQSIAVQRSRRSIAALMDIRPDEARVEREGTKITVSPEDVSVGEIMIVRPGERIALDGVILSGETALDTVSLTGEALPRAAGEGDEVISGCVNLSGLIRVRVTKSASESTVARILELVEESTLVKSKTEHAITKFARYYTPAVVLAAILLAVVPSLITGEWSRRIYSALTFLVISCPCALVISVPLTYFSGLGAASRQGILIKGASYLDVLAKPESVAFDKTGTLTEGHFRVSEIAPVGLSEKELLRLAASAEQGSNHPLARALAQAAAGEILTAPTEVTEYAGRGLEARLDGRRVLVGNAGLMSMNAINCPSTDADGTEVLIAIDGCFAGRISVSDAVKPTARKALSELKTLGVSHLVMLTGDREAVAATVAAELGLTDYRAGLLPADKVGCMEELLAARKTGTLAFVGDGVNDAPVLARADVGIAMGGLGSDAAIEAADVVLMDDDPQSIPRAIRLARRTLRIVRENIIFALAVKAVFLILGAIGLTNMWAATFADVGVAVLAILNAMRAGR